MLLAKLIFLLPVCSCILVRMANVEYYKVETITDLCWGNNCPLQELFQKIDLEDDGIVYLKEIVIYLRIMNEDIDENLKVSCLMPSPLKLKFR